MDGPSARGVERWAAVHTECLQRDGGTPPEAEEDAQPTPRFLIAPKLGRTGPPDHPG